MKRNLLLSCKTHQVMISVWTTILTLSLMLSISIYWLRNAIHVEQTAHGHAVELIRLGDQLAMTSNALTEAARQFVITGESTYLRAYWYEISFRHTRERVLQAVTALNVTLREEILLKVAKENSDKLMTTEIHSMKLVLTALGIPEDRMYPAIQAYPLSATDLALSPAQKLEKAQHLLFNLTYTHAKTSILQPIAEFQTSTQIRTQREVIGSERKVRNYLTLCTVLTGVLTILVLGLVWLRLL
ncbi:MAG: hypothetical protein A3J38_04720 [Gammaproteobacteria bacterium RIFCSPHIGHO2_12_FULL_45_9]|nr:MAG: hypothetical protein A3J38_04720 [Gammaproteobacteria bacterium RIFCSPHIGHO2_12_FULL_45_9]